MLCGIAGEIVFDTSPPDQAAVDRILYAYGGNLPPHSVWQNDRVVLGQVALQTGWTDASPIYDAQHRVAVVFSGRLTNHEALRSELSRGYTFRSGTEQELLLAAYVQWGQNFVRHVSGSFSVVVTDHRHQQVVLARDRLGIQPLYMASVNGRLRFASTLPALAASGGIDTSIDTIALHHYMSWHSIVPAPRTIISGIRKLPPATTQTIQADGTVRQHVYWEPRYQTDARYADWGPAQWRDGITEALQTAIQRCQWPGGVAGVQLSGGLDSSLLVAMLAESGRESISTFSIGFESPGEHDGNEFEYSAQVANLFGTDHHVLRLTASDVVEALDDTILAMSEPMASHDVPAFYLHTQTVADHAMAIQCGQGADEIFVGYQYHRAADGVSREAALATFRDAFVDASHHQLADILNPEWLAATDVSDAVLTQAIEMPGAQTALDAVLRLETQLFLADDPIKRVTNMSMAAGLEACLPFVDHELVELAVACPHELKTPQGGKGILKDIGRIFLPEDIIDRPKGYFPVPALGHLQGALLTKVREALLAPEARQRRIFRPGYLDTLLGSPNQQYAPTGGNTLWKLGLLELWLQHHRLG